MALKRHRAEGSPQSQAKCIAALDKLELLTPRVPRNLGRRASGGAGQI
jgi:hypothetical protein